MTMETPVKQVKIKDETHAELAKIGRYGETMDDIINRCLKAYHQVHKGRRNNDDD